MAITKTEEIRRIDVSPVSGSDPTVVVRKIITFDDEDDNQLPSSQDHTRHIVKYTTTTDEEGVETQVLTDYSGEDALVIAVCGAIWS
jgi:hypothetical protein